MKYNRVFIEAFGYELPPNVVTSRDLEERLSPVYEKLRLSPGQLEALTGISERRWWDPDFPMSEGAALAGQKALESSGVHPSDIGMLVYAGVCRDNLEPATACAVADALAVGPHAAVYDVSNACLGVLNAMVQVADAIELGRIKAGLVVSCESARQIVDQTIRRMLDTPDMETFKHCVATLTGGSGSVAVLLTGEELARNRHRFFGGTIQAAPVHHRLCRWGPDTGIPATMPLVMDTDSVGVLQNGVKLGVQTFRAFRAEMNLTGDQPHKVICHQVGASHQRSILEAIGIHESKDFTTFRHLGNIGTVSLPMTAAIAVERDFIVPGDYVGLFGIGSGLNCLLLGVKW